ncbi:Predicted membrane protein [Candidatus Zixiibacteriota bacterium]|nr:Predicted membrane protein [candidate division Zixibacteria bacterium]
MRPHPEIEKGDRLEITIGNLLRIGVLISAGVVLFGGIIYLWKYGLTRPDYSTFTEMPKSLKELPQIISQSFQLRSQAIIQLGLLLLIATPIARVAFSVAAFLKQRDYFYTVVTLIVLIILLFSLSGG